MKVALGQFAVKREWQENADICLGLMDQAHQQGARLLVLPEAVSARDIADPEWGIKAAQSVDGPFLRLLLAGSLSDTLTTVLPCMCRMVTGVLSTRWLSFARAGL